MDGGGRFPDGCSLPSRPASLPAARRYVADELTRLGASPDVVNDYRLAISELVTNVVEHGGAELLDVRVRASSTWWDVAVVGGRSLPGELATPEGWLVAAPFDRSGRGLGIVRHVMDQIQIDSDDGRLCVHCLKRRV